VSGKFNQPKKERVQIMSIINFGSSVSLKEFAHAIGTVGDDVTIIGQGEPGIGKSAMLKVLAAQYPDHEIAYIDCTLLDLGDFALPYTETIDETLNRLTGVNKITKFAPNARFKMHTGKPVIVMLDEIGKAMKAVKNVLLTLMLEQRIGDNYLPTGPKGEKSKVFGTTNQMSDGVGDMLEAHARNRVAFVTVRKPSADEWIEWAIENGVDPTIIAWTRQYPHALASYSDPAQKDNPYIFNPTRAGTGAVVTPRSLEKASHIAKKRAVLGDALTISLLTGTIGESAARDMQAFFTVVDKLPTWDGIVADPKNAKMPDDTVAKCILVFSAITRVERDTLAKFMAYVQRMDMEWQALFATSVMKSTSKQAFAVTNKEFKDWALKNQWLF
jgi:hypothetical protein